MTFEKLFEAATEHTPYGYQHRLAGGDAHCQALPT